MTSSNGPGDRSVLHIEVSSAHLAIDAAVVREVVGALAVMVLPDAPRGLSGVVPWNGRAVAAVELAPLLGVDAPPSARARTLVVETRACVLAIAVDRVHEPRAVIRQRAAHATRIPFSRLEVELEERTLPLFEVEDFVRSLETAS